MRVAAAAPAIRLADPKGNAEEICRLIDRAEERQVAIAVFAELCVTGYTCGDLFTQRALIRGAEEAVESIAEHTRGKAITAIVGTPVLYHGLLYNCGVVIREGRIHGIVPKIHLPNTSEFYEARWFTSGADLGTGAVIDFAGSRNCPISSYLLFNLGEACFGIELCEDLWAPVPPSTYHCMMGAHIIANLSASDEVSGKQEYRKRLVGQQSSRGRCAYIYACSGWGESTQDTVFGGGGIICEGGELLAEGKRFNSESSLLVSDIDIETIDNSRLKSHTFNSVTPDGTRSSSYRKAYLRVDLGELPETDFEKELDRKLDPLPFIPKGDRLQVGKALDEIIDIQLTGLASRMLHINCKNAVIGVSGGLDSTHALLVTCLAFDKLGLDRKGILAVTMPGYGTSGRTRNNAGLLMDALGVSSREISIKAACDQHFKDIGHDSSIHDHTYENSQARERTQILMDLANKTGGLVVGTGDLSELALGWCTYNGDHMSMYGVNAGVSKTLIRVLVDHLARKMEAEGKAGAEVLRDIIDTPISPELLPAGEDGSIAQVTEDIVGPYELHDFFLYNIFTYGYTPEKICFLARKAFAPGNVSGLVFDGQTIVRWMNTFIHRFFSQQFKRSCLPDGPKVGPVSLSPRGDWRMPSDACPEIWKDNISKI